MHFVTHSFLAVAVQKLLKLFKICQSYWQKFSAAFFGPRCIWIFVTSSRYWLWNGRTSRQNVDGYRPECTPRCPEVCPEGVPCTARWSRNQLWFTDGQLTRDTNGETDTQTDRQTGRQTNRDERNVEVIRRGSSRWYLRCYHDVSIIAAAGCSSHRQCCYNLDLPWPLTSRDPWTLSCSTQFFSGQRAKNELRLLWQRDHVTTWPAKVALPRNDIDSCADNVTDVRQFWIKLYLLIYWIHHGTQSLLQDIQ